MSASAAPSLADVDRLLPAPLAAREHSPLDPQHKCLQRSDRLHAQATRAWLGIVRDAVEHPMLARDTALGLAATLVTQVREDDSTTLRALEEASGTVRSQHTLNVTLLSLLLARNFGLDSAALHTVALGALLHDLGEILLPAALCEAGHDTPTLTRHALREHLTQGLRLGMAMGLDAQVLQIIGRHHDAEGASGPGSEPLAMPARIVTLVNRFDRLCNAPAPGELPVSPHDALKRLRSHCTSRADADVLAMLVQRLGLYPPGSVVQLSDERMARVVAVPAAHPLRPSVRIHDPRVAPGHAALLHLSEVPGLTVHRALNLQDLPRAMRDDLAPRDRIAYGFVQGLATAAPLRTAHRVAA